MYKKIFISIISAVILLIGGTKEIQHFKNDNSVEENIVEETSKDENQVANTIIKEVKENTEVQENIQEKLENNQQENNVEQRVNIKENESKNEKTVEQIDNSKNEVNKNQVVQTKKEQKPESNVGTKDTPINNKETQEKVKTEEIQKTQSNNTEEKNKEEKITEEYIYNDTATKKLINDINEIAKKNPDLWGTDEKKLYSIKVSRSLLGQNYMFPYNYKQVEGKVLNVFSVTFLVYAVDYKKTGFATETRYYIDIE